MKERRLKYSVVTINIGGYELVHEILEKSENAEYILLTDDHSLKSDTWTIKYIENEFIDDPFYTVFKIRYNIFDYVNTDIAFIVDGSIRINKNLDIFIQKMEENNSDCCLFLHNYNKTLNMEYFAWEYFRNYPHEQTEKIKTLVGEDCFYNYKGLLMRTVMVQKNTNNIKKWNDLTFEYCKMLTFGNSLVDRLDQTIESYIIQKYFDGILNPLYFSIELINDTKYFTWYNHGTNHITLSKRNKDIIDFKYYFFNKEVELCKL